MHKMSLRWCVSYVLLLLAILLCLPPACFLQPGCSELRSECGIHVAPTVETDIVTRSGCNATAIWISWEWTTPIAHGQCKVDEVVIKEYTCYYTKDGSQTEQPYTDDLNMSRNRSRLGSGVKMWTRSYPHTWNAASTPMKCEINGKFVILDPGCKQGLHPVNITCSVPPTLTSSILMTSLTHNTITTAAIQKTAALTIQPTSTITQTTPEQTVTHQTTSQSQSLTETREIIVIVTACTVTVLSSITILIVVYTFLQKRLCKKKVPNYYNHGKDLEDFKPDYNPVIPDKVIFEDEILSIRSTIAPLKKTESTSSFTDATEAITLHQTITKSQPQSSELR